MEPKILEKSPSSGSLSKQANSVIYSLLDHEKAESENLPVCPNLLHYNDNFLEWKYRQALICESYSFTRPSTEFKNNLMVFYIFITAYLGILLATSLLLYRKGDLNYTHLVFHLISILALTIIAYSILLLILFSSWFLMNYRPLLMILSFSFLFYLVVGEQKILSEIFSTDSSSDNWLPCTVGITCYIVMVRKPLFECFYLITLLSIASLVFYLGANIAIASNSNYSIFSEFTLFTIFLFLQIIDAYQLEYRSRQLYLRMHTEEQNGKANVVLGSENEKEAIKTEIEMIVRTLDSIKREIRYAGRMIIYNDLKKRLKSSCLEIERIIRIIAHGNFLNVINIAREKDMDEDDKTFIEQNFMSPQPNNYRSPSALISVSEIGEKKINFPFKSYGVNELESVLATVGKNWNFDIWFVYNATGHSIYVLAKYLLKKYSLSDIFKIPDQVIDRYFQTLEKSYYKNPYHNACHAADVLHSVLFFYHHGNLLDSIKSLDLLSSIVAALGHDVGHQALNNRFLVNNREEVALIYNDFSVLENMHCSKTYQIMNKPDCNLFGGLTQEEWVQSRKLIVEMILETDMSKHFEILGRFKIRAVTLSDFNITSQDDKVQLLAMGLKCADIGHSAKPTDLHEKWTKLVCEEFFNQGDIEKAKRQPVSMYCDRDTTDIPKSQAGFLKNICIPLFEVWCHYLHSDSINLLVMEQIKRNYQVWESKSQTRRATMGVCDSLAKEFEKTKRSSVASNDGTKLHTSEF